MCSLAPQDVQNPSRPANAFAPLAGDPLPSRWEILFEREPVHNAAQCYALAATAGQ